VDSASWWWCAHELEDVYIGAELKTRDRWSASALDRRSLIELLNIFRIFFEYFSNIFRIFVVYNQLHAHFKHERSERARHARAETSAICSLAGEGLGREKTPTILNIY